MDHTPNPDLNPNNIPIYHSSLSYDPSTDLKVITIGDPHFKVNNIHESKAMTENLVSMVKQMKPDIIVCLGDILDRHETIHVTPLTLAIEFLEKLKNIAPLYVIIGNHDRPNNSDFMSDMHPFNALKLWDNTTVIDSVYKETFKGKYEFIFMPYVYPGRFLEGISHLPVERGDDVDKDKPNVRSAHCVFGHQEFFGAKMGAIVSQMGDKWPHDYPLVISGHIHDYGRPQFNIVYTGTPMQHAFGDHNSKTVSEFIFYPNMEKRKMDVTLNDSSENANESNSTSLVDHNVNSQKFPVVNNAWSDVGWAENRLDLGLMKRVICRIHPNQISTWVPPENKLVKLVIKGTNAEIKGISGLDRLKELKALGIKIDFKTVDDGYDPTTEEKSSGPQMPYLRSLELATNVEPGVKKWFHTIFGSTEPISADFIKESNDSVQINLSDD